MHSGCPKSCLKLALWHIPPKFLLYQYIYEMLLHLERPQLSILSIICGIFHLNKFCYTHIYLSFEIL